MKNILSKKFEISCFGIAIVSTFAPITKYITVFSTPIYFLFFLLLCSCVLMLKFESTIFSRISIILILLTMIRLPDVIHYSSFSYFLQYLIQFTIFLFFVSRKYKEQDIRFLIQMFIYSGVLMSFCVLLFGGSYHDDEGTLTRHARYSYGLIGPQIEVNHLATYMASVIPFIFYKFIKRKKAFDLFLFIVILWGTYKTGSRAALLSSVFSIIIIILSLINASRIKYVYYIVFVLLLIISFSVMPSNVKNRYFNINSYQDGSNASRLLYWAHALNLFSRSPIIGYGPVNTGLINMRITGLSHVAHNSYLSVLVQYGIIGFLVFFSIPLTIFIKALKHKNTLIVAAFVNIGFSCLIIETELNMALWIILIISVMMLQIKVSAENFIW